MLGIGRGMGAGECSVTVFPCPHSPAILQVPLFAAPLRDWRIPHAQAETAEVDGDAFRTGHRLLDGT